MKTLFKVLATLIIILTAGIVYSVRFTTIKSGSGEVLFYNPFSIDEKGFREHYSRAMQFLEKGDTGIAKEHFAKALEYRGTHNEEVRESIYSCGNGLWEYKQDKLLKFSACYEYLGLIDSAMSCLEPALYNFERYHYPTETQFFRLAMKKYGKDEVVNELRSAISDIRKIDCFMCSDYCFEFKGIKVGLDKTEVEVDNEILFEKLKRKYCS